MYSLRFIFIFIIMNPCLKGTFIQIFCMQSILINFDNYAMRVKITFGKLQKQAGTKLSAYLCFNICRINAALWMDSLACLFKLSSRTSAWNWPIQLLYASNRSRLVHNWLLTIVSSPTIWCLANTSSRGNWIARWEPGTLRRLLGCGPGFFLGGIVNSSSCQLWKWNLVCVLLSRQLWMVT